MIRISHLTKRFGDFAAVNDLTLDVKGGEFVGFLGPNGAGKTTTIKMMTGLFTPTSGSITLGGNDILTNSLAAKMITGYIPDQPFLYEKLTGREFLYFSAGLYRIDHRAATQRIDDLVRMFEIDNWLDRRTEYYSQGMRQRIVIAAALLHHPKILVVDEPMVGLDPRSAHIVKQVFKEQAAGGSTVFMSTHVLSIAEELCTRVAIIKSGMLVFDDGMEVFQQFKSRFNGNFESAFLELTK